MLHLSLFVFVALAHATEESAIEGQAARSVVQGVTRQTANGPVTTWRETVSNPRKTNPPDDVTVVTPTALPYATWTGLNPYSLLNDPLALSTLYNPLWNAALLNGGWNYGNGVLGNGAVQIINGVPQYVNNVPAAALPVASTLPLTGAAGSIADLRTPATVLFDSIGRPTSVTYTVGSGTETSTVNIPLTATGESQSSANSTTVVMVNASAPAAPTTVNTTTPTLATPTQVTVSTPLMTTPLQTTNGLTLNTPLWATAYNDLTTALIAALNRTQPVSNVTFPGPTHIISRTGATFSGSGNSPAQANAMPSFAARVRKEGASMETMEGDDAKSFYILPVDYVQNMA